eukprot:12926287-Prorocentrum_lima.AAC.1
MWLRRCVCVLCCVCVPCCLFGSGGKCAPASGQRGVDGFTQVEVQELLAPAANQLYAALTQVPAT